jgi:metal-responsive CopG/Arc/MetJ family transcriptional regulator
LSLRLRLDLEVISLDDDGMRTIVDLPEEQIKALDTYRKRHGISRAEAVRRAVAAFLPAKPHKKIDFRKHPAFGSSKAFHKEDSVELVRRLRDEWR